MPNKMRLLNEQEGSVVAFMTQHGDYKFCIRCGTVLLKTWEKLPDHKTPFDIFVRDAKMDELFLALYGSEAAEWKRERDYEVIPEGLRQYWLDERQLIRCIESDGYPDPYSASPASRLLTLRRGDGDRSMLYLKYPDGEVPACCDKCLSSFEEIELERTFPNRKSPQLAGGYGSLIGVWGPEAEFCINCFQLAWKMWQVAIGLKIHAPSFYNFAKRGPVSLFHQTLYGDAETGEERYWADRKTLTHQLVERELTDSSGDKFLILREGHGREQALIEDGVCHCCGRMLIQDSRDN